MPRFAASFVVLLLAALAPGGCRVGEPAPLALDDDAMLERFIERSMPGDAHERLARLEGAWEQRVSFWTAPDTAPDETTLHVEYRWIMGGRFLQGEVLGDFEGTPFHGLELIGHDNLREEYRSIWIDTMGTAFLVSRGRYDPATRTLEMRGTNDDILTGRRDRPFRTVTDFSAADRIVHEMYATGPDGGEFLALRSEWTRPLR